MGKSKRKITRPQQYVAKANRKKKPMDKRILYGILGGVGVLVLAVVIFLAVYDDGSLPIRNGAVVTGGDNWIVANLSNATNGQRYYKLGEVNTPEGFTLDPDTHYVSDTNLTDFVFHPEDENSQFESLYYMGIKGKNSTLVPESHDLFAQFYGEETVSEIQSATVDMHPVQYYTFTRTETQEEADARAGAEAAEKAEQQAAGAENAANTPAEAEATPEAQADSFSGEGATDTVPEATAEGTTPEATPAPEETPAVPKTVQTLNCYIATTRGGVILAQATLNVTDAMPALNDAEIADVVERLVGNLVLDPFKT